MPPWLTLSIIRYGSRVKWSNPGEGVAPSQTPWCSSYRKGILRVTLDYGRQLYFLLFIYKDGFSIKLSLPFDISAHKESKAVLLFVLLLFILFSTLNYFYHTHTHTHGHLPPITKTIQARRTRHAGHCWRSKDEIVGDVLLWTPSYGQSKAGRQARTYIQQLCDDTGCNPEDVP